MPSSTAEDQPRTVTGYPAATGYPQTQPGYPPPAYHSYSTTSNAYPYSAPPPASSYPPQPYGSRSTRTTLIRGLIITVIAIVVIIFAVGFIMWLILHPQAPVFRVESLSVPIFNLSDSQLIANWDVGLVIVNPNKKMKMFYDSLDTYIFYGENILSVISLQPFYLGKKEQETVHAKLGTNSMVDELVAQKIDGDRSRGLVRFSVRIAVSARFKAGSWLTRRKSIRVYCEGLQVMFLSTTGEGTMMGGTTECLVYL